MRHIFLLTIGFPYGNSEPFISNELRFCDNLTIVSSYIGKDVSYDLSKTNNVEVWHLDSPFFKGNKFSFFVKAISSFFSKYFWIELFGSDIKPLNFKKIKQLISAITKARAIFLYCSKMIKKLGISGNDCCFYSYWMNHLGIATIMLRNKFGGIAVSRCHGYDLYKRPENNNYVSFQKYLSKSLNYVLPISKDGEEIICSILGKDSSKKVMLSRLGTFDEGLNPPIGSNNKFVVVSCSNIVSLKRIDLIFRSLTLIEGRKVEWHHFGDGPNYDSVFKMIKNTESNIEVIFHGRQPNGVVLEFYKYNHVDLFINLSISEGIPVSMMEAQSFGIPCLATDVGGTHEIVNNKNGWLVEKTWDDNQIARVLNKIVSMTPEEINKFRLESRASWRANYYANCNYSRFYSFLGDNDEKKD